MNSGTGWGAPGISQVEGGGKEQNEERNLGAGQCEEVTMTVRLGHIEDCGRHENNGVMPQGFNQRGSPGRTFIFKRLFWLHRGGQTG